MLAAIRTVGAFLPYRNDYNGIDFIEVVDDPSMPVSQRQRTLRVYFLRPLAPNALDIRNVVITGGERIRNVAPVQVYEEGFTSPPGDPLVLVVVVNVAGDFTSYTLSLVDPSDTAQPPAGFDRVLSSIDFSFKAACSSTSDCQRLLDCPPPLVRRHRHFLSRQRLRQLPRADAGPPRGDHAAMAAKPIRPISASCWSNGWRSSATISVISRTLLRPRPICGRRDGALRCGGMSGSSITRCMTAATRAASCISTSAPMSKVSRSRRRPRC